MYFRINVILTKFSAGTDGVPCSLSASPSTTSPSQGIHFTSGFIIEVFFYKSGTYVLYPWVLQAGQHQRPGLCEVFPQVQVTTGSDLTSCSSSVWLSLVQNPKCYETKHQLQHVHHVSIFLIKGESAYQELPKEVSYLGDQPVQAEVLSHIQLSP